MSNRSPQSAQPPRIRAELHTHTTFSDGQHEPEQLARMCAELGVEIWSLTDHDTCHGCARAAAAAATHGIEFIPGVEVSARLDRSIHVLGYGVDPTDDELVTFMDDFLERRSTRMDRMVERVQDLGLEVTMEEVTELSGGGTLARPHLARALVARGHVETVQEAFDRYLDRGQPCYIPSPSIEVAEAIERIHQAGGLAVLAHPGDYDRDEAIAGWVDQGLDGIEVDHPTHTEADRARYLEIAREHGLLITASSDFHGERVAPERRLGVTELPEGWVARLRERLG